MPSINDSKVVLVIGATSGIGRALALAIHNLPSKPTVIVAGRRKARLDEVLQQGGKLDSVQLDVNANREDLKSFVDNIVVKYPDLDTVILAAGIQYQFDFTKPDTIDLDEIAKEVDTNYTTVISLTKFFLPHLLKLASEGRPTFLMPITSGLAIVPGANIPNYSATKSALHNLCISLQTQLKGTNVHVVEIIPGLVESELHDQQGTTAALSKFWMPLDEYTSITMEGLQSGGEQVMTPQIKGIWDKFEDGKAKLAEGIYAHMNKL